MYHFRNDYSEGAHPRVLEALIRTNLESTAGYGEDAYCAAAAAAIRTRFGCPSAAVHWPQTPAISPSTKPAPWRPGATK